MMRSTVTSTRTLPEMLSNEGIADLTGMWSADTVADWSRRLDPLFKSTDGEERSYVSADGLVETGIFAEVFTEPVRQLIAGIQPSALLYHCHCYEIAGNQEKTHIHRDKPQGWHRDNETLRNYLTDFPNFISIFILLTPVGDDDGAFEFFPTRPNKGMRAGGEIVRLVGPVGTAAIWNRSYFHRASPNRGSVRRRILKISFQPAGLPNERIDLPEFRDAFAKLQDPALRALIDPTRVGSSTPLPFSGDPTVARPLAPSGHNELTKSGAAILRAQTIGLRLMSHTGVSGLG